jgi:hypothetical protein
MKKILIAALITLLFASCVVKRKPSDNSVVRLPVQQTDSSLTKFQRLALSNSSKMIFKIAIPNAKISESDKIVINLQFENVTNEDIKLVDLFDSLKTNFSLEITSENKTISALGPVLASYPSFYNFKYITVPPKQIYERAINLSDVLRKEEIQLKPGVYKVKMTYSNNNGKNCIVGSFNSNTTQFALTN